MKSESECADRGNGRRIDRQAIRGEVLPHLGSGQGEPVGDLPNSDSQDIPIASDHPIWLPSRPAFCLAGRLDDPILEEIRRRAPDLVECLLGYPLKVEGANAIYRVPWREDNTPSLKVLLRDHNGHRAGFWKDFGREESGDVLDLVMRVKRLSFPDAKAWCAQQLSIPVSDPFKDTAEGTFRTACHANEANSAHSRESLASHYGLEWKDFEEVGCRWVEQPVPGVRLPAPMVAYPLRVPDGSLRLKYKSAIRIDGKRQSRPAEPGSGWQDGLFTCGLDGCTGATLVITEGEEKALAAKAVGRCAASPPNGASSFGKSQAKMILAAGPSRIILAFDADEAGAKGMQKAHDDLRTAGYLGEILTVQWPEDAAQGRDLSDLLLEDQHDLEDFLDSAVRFEASPETPASQATAASSIIVWPEIVPLGEKPLPPFPIEVFAKAQALRDMVEQLAEATQTPTDLAGMMAFAVLAAAMSGRAGVRVRDGWTEPTNLYVMAAQEPGTRKSAVVSILVKPILDYEEHLQRFSSAERHEIAARQDVLAARLVSLTRKSGRAGNQEDQDAFVSEIARIRTEIDQLPPTSPPRLLCEDTTPERLASLLAENDGGIAVISDEGTLASILLGRYTNGTPNFEVILKGHDGSPVRIDRRNRAEHIKRPAVTLGLAIQPEVLREMASQRATRGKGLLARFLYTCPATLLGARKSDPNPVLPGVLLAYSALVQSFLDLPKPAAAGHESPPELVFSRDALNHLLAFQDQLERRLGKEGDLGDLADWAGKLTGAIARIAGLLHMAEGGRAPGWISGDTAERALLLGEYLIAHAQRAFTTMFASPEIERAERVLNWLKRKGVREFSAREAWLALKSPSRFPRMKDLREALSCLEDHGHLIGVCSVTRPATGGRPRSERYAVNAKSHL